MYWFFRVLRKYAVFKGRARRREYWIFYLDYMIIVIILFILMFLSLVFSDILSKYTYAVFTTIQFLLLSMNLAILIPSIAVTVRRLHDTNRSGLWFFLIFIPLIGSITQIIFLVQNSQSGENRFGPNPKSAEVKKADSKPPQNG